MRVFRLLTLLLAACLNGGPGNAALNTGVGLGVGAYKVSHHEGCWAVCQAGTMCDKKSGLCVNIPCGGCPVGQECQVTPVGEQCVLPGVQDWVPGENRPDAGP